MLVRSRACRWASSTMSSKISGVCGWPSETKSAPGKRLRRRDISGSSPTLVLSTSTTSTGPASSGGDEGHPVRPQRRLVDGRERGGAGLELHADLLEADRRGGHRRRGSSAGRPAASTRVSTPPQADDQAAGDQRPQRLGRHLVGRDLAQAHQQVELPVDRARRRRRSRSRRRGCRRRGRSVTLAVPAVAALEHVERRGGRRPAAAGRGRRATRSGRPGSTVTVGAAGTLGAQRVAHGLGERRDAEGLAA